MSTFDIARALNSAAQSSNPHWVLTAVLKRDGVGGKMASMLANLIPDGQIEHIDASISDETDDALARVAAFTTDRIVVVQVAGKDSPTAISTSRSALQSIALNDVPNFFAGSSGEGGEYRVELDYGQALGSFGHIHLGHSKQSGQNFVALRDFVPSLLQDMQAPSSAGGDA
ncbi:hypothetical protein ABID92_000410 [Frigoribacterium sp. PvP120]|uniref:hypothetical protein n=1 Tax=unclassified Frigoribacterium TaxID=2627005 RepID=UPI001AEB03F3|nr:hypothetical protein [Frigoribacterium sp. PvP121]MBP1241762.1 hypothetical protein [Frigoribacterium sp. PvP121]